MHEQEQHEAERQQLLQMVETALRAGRTESQIVKLVDDAVEADAELDRAA